METKHYENHFRIKCIRDKSQFEQVIRYLDNVNFTFVKSIYLFDA